MSQKPKVLVVEDEPMLGFAFKMMLEDMGADVVGPFTDAASTFRALESTPVDAAFLDVNLGGRSNSFSIADHFMERNVPFAFVSGYGSGTIDTQNYVDIPKFTKPMRREEIANFVQSVSSTQINS